MTKASDNLFPSLLLVEQGSTPASPSAGDQRLFIKTSDHLYYTVNSSGTVTAVGGGGGATSSLLAITSYAATQTYTTTSNTFVDVDATNLKITFTAPASGNVLVRLQAIGSVSGVGNMQWGLREGTTDLGVTGVAAGSNDTYNSRRSMDLYITGIGAGSHTYKWAWCRATATAAMYTDSIDGPAVMEVWAAP